jgi:pimeloyl-ACP methyl ester carboxylesterase
MGALADGLAGVLEAEGVPQAHVLSGSFGGMLALSFVQRHADRTGRLILSSTAIPGPAEARAYAKTARLVSRLPSPLARGRMKRHLLRIVDPPEAERAFWAAYLDELFGYRLSKADILSTLRCIVDFAETAPRSPDDLPGWQGETLLLASDDDHTFGAEAQAALRGVLDRVQVHTFQGAGHSPAMTQPEQFFGAVRDFLA